MVEQERILIRQHSRIMVPSTYFNLREALNPEYRLICDGLVNTGARVVEFWAICKHPEWYFASRRIIDLPATKIINGKEVRGAAKKPMMEQTNRTIKLSIKGVETMDAIYAEGIGKHTPSRYVHGAEKDRSSFGQALTRAAIRAKMNPEGINPKSFRKDHAAWLLEIRKDLGIEALDVARSLGHDLTTLVKHYDGSGFTKEEHNDMLEYFKGYGQ